MRLTKTNKYGNSKVSADGYVFDSKKEHRVYSMLKDMEIRGVISGLEVHPKWELIPKITERYVKHLKTKDKECERTVQLPITYTADFAFDWRGARIVADVKASKAMLPKEFILKEKMMRYFHGITITKIYALKDLAQFEKND